MDTLDESLKSQVRELKKTLRPDDGLIKNKFGKNVQKVSKSKWAEIQGHMDASFWDRLDDKV